MNFLPKGEDVSGYFSYNPVKIILCLFNATL